MHFRRHMICSHNLASFFSLSLKNKNRISHTFEQHPIAILTLQQRLLQICRHPKGVTFLFLYRFIKIALRTVFTFLGKGALDPYSAHSACNCPTYPPCIFPTVNSVKPPVNYCGTYTKLLGVLSAKFSSTPFNFPAVFLSFPQACSLSYSKNFIEPSCAS